MSDAFFGIQVAVQVAPRDPWRQQLAQLVRGHQRDLPVQDQRTFWGSFANLLREATDRCPLGFWDFVPDGKAEYDDWVQGIEDDAAETWAPDPTGAAMDLVLVSALFLLPRGGGAALFVADRCDLPEAAWMLRSTFRHLFETVARLEFGSVRATAAYLIPGGDGLGFARRELQGEGYEYLLPLR